MSETQDLNSEHKQSSNLLIGLTIGLHALNHLISGGLPVLYPDIVNEFHLSYSQLGLLNSVSSFSTGFPQMFVGFLRRWFSGRVLISVGNILNSLFNILASLTGNFYQFLTVRVLSGIGSSPQHPVGASLITSNTDASKRGQFLGLNQAIPSIAFTFTPLLTALLLSYFGWRTILSFLSIPAMILSFVMFFFVRGSRESEQTMEDAFSWIRLGIALKNRNVISISLVRTVMAFRMGVRTFFPLYFINILGFSKDLSSILYSIMIFGGVIGPFFWGYLSDRMNRKPIIIGVLIASSILYFLIRLVTDIWLLVPLLFLIGFMVQTVVVQSILSESVEPSQLDQIFGFYFTLGFTLASFSSIIYGFIVENFGFGTGFTYIAAITAISLIPAFFITEPRDQS
jgi:sugar phosphate permease